MCRGRGERGWQVGGSAAVILPLLQLNYFTSVTASNDFSKHLYLYIFLNNISCYCPALALNLVWVLKALHTVDLRNPSCVVQEPCFFHSVHAFILCCNLSLSFSFFMLKCFFSPSLSPSYVTSFVFLLFPNWPLRPLILLCEHLHPFVTLINLSAFSLSHSLLTLSVSSTVLPLCLIPDILLLVTSIPFLPPLLCSSGACVRPLPPPPLHSQITINRGEECVLEDNTQRTKWKVISPTGNEAMVPSVCFTVPPPNQEAVNTASKWASQQRLQWFPSGWRDPENQLLFGLLFVIN